METKEKNRWCGGRVIEGKVVDEKPLDPVKVVRGKPTLYDWGVKGQKSQAWHEIWKSKGGNFDKAVGKKLRVVTYNYM